ncbi:MAG: CCA tRNA nucleotidyltransferase [Nitrospiraceae bacterium]|nr:MAG: CCA tRNA nucleotidyltransferase [Nitrospiraceae bacterium]
MQTVSLNNWLSCKDINIPELYLVGGTVRDLLLDCSPRDIDLVCRDAKVFAQNLAQCRKAAFVPMEKKPDEPCYRVVDREDSENYLDIAEMRGDTIYEDLSRRDFTINAIAIGVKDGSSAGVVIDPLNGAADIERKIIRLAGDESILSDPLRILRAVRLSAGLDFAIEEQTLKEMGSRAAMLKDVAAERVTAELRRILETPRSARYFRQMDDLGILEVIFPEIHMMKVCTQNGFHHTDVWEHSLLTMEHTEHIINNLSDYFGEWSARTADYLKGNSRLSLLKLSALFHDAGKPATKNVNSDTGRTTFYSHAEEGAKLMGLISERLKMSKRDRDFMVLLTEEHLQVFNLASEDVKADIRTKWFRKTGDDAIAVFILGMADTMSSLGPNSSASIRESHIKWSQQTVREYFEKTKMEIESPDFVSGKDLIALGMMPGPDMGRILGEIRNAQDAGKIRGREEALELAGKLAARRRK